MVSEAVFANPFSEQRVEIDRKISGRGLGEPWEKVRPEAIAEVAKRITELDAGGAVTIDDFGKADRDLIVQLFLFDVYYQFTRQFDKLILDQIEIGDEPIRVPFADDALSRLRRRGFSPELSKRYFSLFYQIRRAFHFIDRGLIGRCRSMEQLRMNLWNNIFTYDIWNYQQYLWDRMEDFSILLLGPTGCGKGAAAAAIGRSGYIPFDRKKQSFAESFTKIVIQINLSQFPETLLESELFGHTKGAFTGAVGGHDGLFAMCGPHGSIFLDEIGELSCQVQIKLLQVLQERVFSPVGSHKKLRFNGRVIAATNRDINKLRGQGKFRDDFYYRLCSDCIAVPSLQQRVHENPDELDELIAHTVELITGTRSGQLIRTVVEVIEKRLGRDYPWPGNVRELAQCVRRVIVKRDYQGDTADAGDSQGQFIADIEGGALDADGLLGGYCAMLYQRYGTYEQVARVTGLDRRTVKKHIQHCLAED